MTIFQTPLISLMHQRLQYLSKRSQILTENIARADIIGAKRKDIKPFEDLVNRKKIEKASSSSSKIGYNLNIKNNDLITFNQEIERELEILDLSHNSLNHQAIIDVLGTMHRLYKTAIGRTGS
jgi:flagellar basal body rod protein FlgB